MAAASLRSSLLSAALLFSACGALSPGLMPLNGVSVSDSGVSSGPTVLVFAGGRAGQDFPRLALEQASAWALLRGRLVIVSLSADELPSGFTGYVEQLGPDYALELRQDFYHARAGLETLGGTVLYRG